MFPLISKSFRSSGSSFNLFSCSGGRMASSCLHYSSAAGTGAQGTTPSKPTKVDKPQQPAITTVIRVRRARVADACRVLKFVREHAQSAWPTVTAPPTPIPNLLLVDYTARILAQGHTLLAEQKEAARVSRQLAGLALGAKQCPWDSALMDQWASCVRCEKSRALIRMASHCLKGPELHQKYNVAKILQILLIVPEGLNSSEISMALAKTAIKRGKNLGYPILRFDVTDQTIAQVLENMKLTKEWQFSTDKIEEFNKDGKFTAKKIFSVYSAQGSTLG